MHEQAGCAPRWDRVLDLLSVMAFLFVLLSVVLVFIEDVVGGTLLAICAVVAVVLWFRLRRRREPWAAYSLVAVATIGAAFPGGGQFATILVLVSIALLGFVVGLDAALVGVAVIIALLVGELVMSDVSFSDTASQATGATALFLVAAGLGGLLRRIADAGVTATLRGGELAVANDRLRAAIVTERELVLAQERARAARELHDGLGHLLTVTSMSLQFARRTRSVDGERAWSEVEAAAATNQEALDVMRLWARALDPPPPALGAGGAATFDAIAESFRGTGLEVVVTHNGTTEPLPDAVSLFGTRLVQEGLTNVLRHAGATRVEIDVQQSPLSARIALLDNGAGRSDFHDGFGLRSLRARAEALGGNLTCGPGPGGGWELVAVLPLVVVGTATGVLGPHS